MKRRVRVHQYEDEESEDLCEDEHRVEACCSKQGLEAAIKLRDRLDREQEMGYERRHRERLYAAGGFSLLHRSHQQDREYMDCVKRHKTEDNADWSPPSSDDESYDCLSYDSCPSSLSSSGFSSDEGEEEESDDDDSDEEESDDDSEESSYIDLGAD